LKNKLLRRLKIITVGQGLDLDQFGSGNNWYILEDINISDKMEYILLPIKKKLEILKIW
jgi:hypothetical protein